MAFVIEKLPGENVLLETGYPSSDPFAIGISNKAFFLPAKKTMALTSDPFYFRRVPITDMREVRIRRLRPLFLYVLAAVMVVAGVYTTIGMFTGAYEGKIYGWPIAVAVGGLVLPFAARGRYSLVVTQVKGTYRWKPPLVIDKASKARIASILSSIVAASRNAGVRVVDDRVM